MTSTVTPSAARHEAQMRRCRKLTATAAEAARTTDRRRLRRWTNLVMAITRAAINERGGLSDAVSAEAHATAMRRLRHGHHRPIGGAK